MKIFCDYSETMHNYLRICGNDVSRLDARVAAGETLTFISSHHRSSGGWKKGLDATSNDRPGEYLAEGANMVLPDEFSEWHGGASLGCWREKSKLSDYPCNLSQGFVNDGLRDM